MRLARFELATYGLGNRCCVAENTMGSRVSGDRDFVLAVCLALLDRLSPDLRYIVEHWTELPEAVQAGLLAIVCASRTN